MNATLNSAHRSLIVSIIIGTSMNLIALYGGYDFYRMSESGSFPVCTRQNGIGGFVTEGIGILIGLPFCLYGTIYSRWSSWKTWIWCVPLAVLLNLSPFWVSDKADGYVMSVHHASITGSGCD